MLLFRQVLLLCRTPQIQNNKMISAQRSYNFSEKQEASDDTKVAAWGKKGYSKGQYVLNTSICLMSAKFL